MKELKCYKRIKDFLKVPIVNEKNIDIKNDIILSVSKLLQCEKLVISNLIDFSNIKMQRYDDIEVRDDSLILKKGLKEDICPIKNSRNLVEKTISEYYKKSGLITSKEVLLSELKELPVIDTEKQGALKDYIDDLVFALYFNIQLDEIGFDKAKDIKVILKKNNYYQILNEYLEAKNENSI